MSYGRGWTNNYELLRSSTHVNKTVASFRCLLCAISGLCSFIMCTALCLQRTLPINFPEGPYWAFFVNPNVILQYLKASPCFEAPITYQSTVVFAVLVGEVSNGGCDAGTQEMLSLLKVALVDIIQELVVSVHINRRMR